MFCLGILRLDARVNHAGGGNVETMVFEMASLKKVIGR